MSSLGPGSGGSSVTIDTDGTLAGNSDLVVPSQKAVKTYVDASVVGLLDDKGNQDCSANPNYPAALKGDIYTVSVAGKIGGASGITVDVGDVFRATANNAGGTQASVGTSWSIVQANLVGALINGGALGTPSSGTATNLTGTAAGLTAGAVTNGAYTNVANAYTVQQNGPAGNLTSSSAHIAWNLNTVQVGFHTMTENTTLDNPSNMVQGGTYILVITQHASAAKTLGFGNAYKTAGGSGITISTGLGAIDVITFVCTGTTMLMVAQKAFS